MTTMQFANSVNEMLSAFDPSPLKGQDLKEFYYDGTMEVRTGDRYDSPIQDIYEACEMPSPLYFPHAAVILPLSA